MKAASIGLLLTGLLTSAALAQPAPAPAPPAPLPLLVPNPNYVSIVQEIAVDRPAAEVWARIGKYCGIAEWFGTTCAIVSGKEGELGAVRQLNNGAVLEILVAKTDLSYSYTQPVRTGGAPYNLYHGTVEVKLVTAKTSKIVYSLFYDNSALADDAAKARDRDNRATRFMGGLKNMKILAEGGTLPPPAPPAPR